MGLIDFRALDAILPHAKQSRRNADKPDLFPNDCKVSPSPRVKLDLIGSVVVCDG
jgi:hypothetical protein